MRHIPGFVQVFLLLRAFASGDHNGGITNGPISSCQYFPINQVISPASQSASPRTLSSPTGAYYYYKQCPWHAHYQWHFRPIATPSPTGYNNSLVPIGSFGATSSAPSILSVSPSIRRQPGLVVDSTTMTASVTTNPPREYTTRAVATNEQPLPTPPPFSHSLPPRSHRDCCVINNYAFAERPNPCPNDGTPLLHENNNPATCNFVVIPNGGCPTNYWCHTGSSLETTTCCPNQGPQKDRCDLPKSNGDGDELIPRWYFDVEKRKCRRFLYRGMRGNSNNFVTSLGCVESCETTERLSQLRNPCASGEPARDPVNMPILCGEGGSSTSFEVADDPYQLFSGSRSSKHGRQNNGCPSGYYCHFGADASSSVCCEAAGGDPCKLDANEGEGTAMFARWYFNQMAGDCWKFIYKGRKGNANNFPSLHECRRKCLAEKNPCPGTPKKGQQLGSCSLCGDGEWCHFGSSYETTACCHGAAPDPCKLPLNFGQGEENLTRWYVDTSKEPCSRVCRPFNYRGMKGNQNNFLSREQCESICQPADCPLPNPCSDAELLMESNGSARRCNSSVPCPVNYWCHYGATSDTTVCCTGVQRACDLPKERGRGSKLLSRWYYDRGEQHCKEFTYSGIGGNQNNYLSEDECLRVCNPFDNACSTGQPLMVDGRPKICSPEQRCPGTHFCHISPSISNYCCPKNGDPCSQPMLEGLGPYSIPRFFYDRHTQRCTEFEYKGAKGNANNFLTLEDCQLVCHGFKNPCHKGNPLIDPVTHEPLICGTEDQHCPAGYFCHVGSSPETTNCCPGARKACDSAIETGSGEVELERWGYDSVQRTCRRFIYAGLKGNANNFISREACETRCPTHYDYCPHGRPLLDKNRKHLITCGAYQSCPERYICHNNLEHGLSVCCENPANFCLQARERGDCHGKEEEQYGYNPLTDTCVPYQWSGCGGTLNRFDSFEKCTRICCREYATKLREDVNLATRTYPPA